MKKQHKLRRYNLTIFEFKTKKDPFKQNKNRHFIENPLLKKRI